MPSQVLDIQSSDAARENWSRGFVVAGGGEAAPSLPHFPDFFPHHCGIAQLHLPTGACHNLGDEGRVLQEEGESLVNLFGECREGPQVLWHWEFLRLQREEFNRVRAAVRPGAAECEQKVT